MLASLLVAATPAAAARPATHREAAQIRGPVAVFIALHTSQAPRDSRITEITVSTANPNYAVVDLQSERAGPSKVLVHRVGRRWHVIGFAFGAFSCSLAPPAVFADLFGSPTACIPDGY